MPAWRGPAVQRELDAYREALRVGGSLAGHFDPGELTAVRVPARLDVMGGIADYSGANVCQFPLAHGAVLGIQPRADRWIRVLSAGIERHGLVNRFSLHVGDFRRGKQLRSYDEMRQLLAADAKRSWAAYVVGAIFVLLKEKRLPRLSRGFNIGLLSHVPMNVGIGSSATVEVATLYAVDRVLGLDLDPLELARLGQVAEHRVVGAPCGIMDQIATACGHAGRLLHILCQPGQVVGDLAVPDFCELAGINSHVRHSVGGEKYTTTRVATFMGRRILFERIRKTARLGDGQAPFGGYLCNIAPEDFRVVYRHWLPRRLTGAAFLKRYGTTEDPVAPVDPKAAYQVASRTSHPIHENQRVLEFIRCLENARLSGDRRFLVRAGQLMYASHWSYARKCAQSCREVDFLVKAARRMGPEEGVYGAKITGGGSGGTVALLGEKGKLRAAVRKLTAAYRQVWGIRADVFLGSSPGACEFGSLRLGV